MKPDARDVMLFGGWLLLTVGAALLSVPWGLVAGGVSMFLVAVFGIAPARGGS